MTNLLLLVLLGLVLEEREDQDGSPSALHQGGDHQDRSVIMTKCEFFTEDDRITGFSVSGHSGYAEAGQDIVCAAVSAVVSMAEATINEVCGAKAKVRVKDEDARVTLTLPVSCDEEESVQAVLTGLMLTLCSIRDDYPDYIEVLEV